MNECFPHAHPSLATFVDTIKKQSQEQAERLDDVRYGKAVKPTYEDLNLPDITTAYKNHEE